MEYHRASETNFFDPNWKFPITLRGKQSVIAYLIFVSYIGGDEIIVPSPIVLVSRKRDEDQAIGNLTGTADRGTDYYNTISTNSVIHTHTFPHLNQ